jgi:histidyl-tRNA synthetase
MYRRNHIFSVIREVFQLYAFQPIETPAMENLSTLMGKYGEEGDKLLFRILNSGDISQGLQSDDLKNGIRLSNKLSEKGLRYDLTVPFARFVVMNHGELSFPFKRYQIQNVWRADRPQRGRYREFYQCDADVIGSNSLLNEAELLSMVDRIFSRLGIAVRIHLNNRKILSGIADCIGAAEKLTDITTAIDKIDKIGIEKVKEELVQRNLNHSQIAALEPFLLITGSNEERLLKLKQILGDSVSGAQGVSEMTQLLAYVRSLDLGAEVLLDLTLARGLDYYTGSIIEVKSKDVQMGSICGGGRYDDLTGVFGLKNMPGVGISFGADRIYDVMTELGLFPASAAGGARVLFANLGVAEENYCLPLLTQLRNAGIPAEIYPEADKLKKQLTYANRKGIPFVLIAGSDEMNRQSITVKDMVSGSQSTIATTELGVFEAFHNNAIL